MFNEEKIVFLVDKCIRNGGDIVPLMVCLSIQWSLTEACKLLQTLRHSFLV